MEGVRFDLLDQDLSEFLLNLIARTKGDGRRDLWRS